MTGDIQGLIRGCSGPKSKSRSLAASIITAAGVPAAVSCGRSLEDAAQVIDSIAASRRAFITFGGPL
jgi:hypothetical protein